MYSQGEVIDFKYKIIGVCSNSGGMGTILFVDPIESIATNKIVLKYCKSTDDESIKRFKREVRLLASFKGNSKVVQIIDHNLEHDPAYYVMNYYQHGDLQTNAAAIRASLVKLEQTIIQMIDCLNELHLREIYHRDIKPQNFLLNENDLVVSDFGLTTEIGTDTAFTRSSVAWGTQGYIPPEFLTGGFKHANSASDVFMLGKTIYYLVSNRDPMYLIEDDIPPPLFYIIERCCSVNQRHRYQTLPELRQAVVAAFDLLLSRGGGIGKVKQLLSSIKDRLERESKYSSSEIVEFINQLALLDEDDQIKFGFEFPSRLFNVMRQKPVASHLSTFLSIYEKLVESKGYSWSYAENIADNMHEVFSGGDVSNQHKKFALELAIRAANYMNRFAAMDTCRKMIISVSDDNLGFHIAEIIKTSDDSFVYEIEPSECKCSPIIQALKLRQISAT